MVTSHPSVDETSRTLPYGRVVVLFFCVVLVALALTWTFLGMRSVMDIGGACAEGGPYVPVQPCPDGTWMLAVAVPMLIILSMLGSAVAMSLSAPNLLVPMWGLLFGSLGWNFLEYGAFDGEPVWGWMVCGVVFELMALPALLLAVASLRGGSSWSPPVPTSGKKQAEWTGGLWWWPAYAGLAVIGATLGTWSFRAWS